MAKTMHTLLPTILLTAAAAAAQQVCNNAAALCGKRYNEVTQLGAHDSPFVRRPDNLYTPAGDQFYNSTAQLDGGVRMLTAQIHKAGADYKLCHTSCLLYDAGLVHDWLADIKGWMDRNADEGKVVTLLLVNSDNADAATLDGLFKGAAIADYAYTPASTTSPSTTWPTLGDMIASNKRLVTFIPDLDPSNNTAAPYLLDEFTFAFENSYHNDNTSAFGCALDRPSGIGDAAAAVAKGYLPLMNHFLYDAVEGIEISAPEHADTVNHDGGDTGNLGAAADACAKAYGRAPAFMLTDFSNIGPAVAVADRLNGVSGATSGRRALPTTLAETLLDFKGASKRDADVHVTAGHTARSAGVHQKRALAAKAKAMRRDIDERLAGLASVLAAGGAAALWMGGR